MGHIFSPMADEFPLDPATACDDWECRARVRHVSVIARVIYTGHSCLGSARTLLWMGLLFVLFGWEEVERSLRGYLDAFFCLVYAESDLLSGKPELRTRICPSTDHFHFLPICDDHSCHVWGGSFVLAFECRKVWESSRITAAGQK